MENMGHAQMAENAGRKWEPKSRPFRGGTIYENLDYNPDEFSQLRKINDRVRAMSPSGSLVPSSVFILDTGEPIFLWLVSKWGYGSCARAMRENGKTLAIIGGIAEYSRGCRFPDITVEQMIELVMIHSNQFGSPEHECAVDVTVTWKSENDRDLFRRMYKGSPEMWRKRGGMAGTVWYSAPA
jgi:hypothetical protein